MFSFGIMKGFIECSGQGQAANVPVCKNDDCFLQGELKILKGKQEPGETRAKL
jgi:hypothetical protein